MLGPKIFSCLVQPEEVFLVAEEALGWFVRS